jgi:hypothetical protein
MIQLNNDKKTEEETKKEKQISCWKKATRLSKNESLKS